VVQNRPPPLRAFDQIFMRAGDMVLQSEFMAHWAKDRSVAFVGDGDAISVAVAYLRAAGILDYGPSRVAVFDFDERIISSIRRFAKARGIDWLEAHLYNCLDPIPPMDEFDCFYSNPPWGASNGGQSVMVFAQRGRELIGHDGEGLLVVADRNPEHEWTENVLAGVQGFAVTHGFYVSRMMPRLHSYHLDDNPELLSCNLILRSRPGNTSPGESEPIRDLERLDNFYKMGGGPPRVRYVRDETDANESRDQPRFELFDEGGTDE
jgi:predicted methyltransferase